MEFVSILNYNVFSGDLSNALNAQKTIVNTINPHSYCVARKDQTFQKALLASDILLPDGIGIVLASRILTGQKIRKIAGAEIHQYCIELANRNGAKVFYLGASQTTLNKIHERLAIHFPSIIVDSYSPPYKHEFSEEDNAAMIAAVNTFKPDFLFVGMTAPKQEKWVFEHKDQLNARVMCSIGAVFDFYAGTVKRPHPFWIKLGLEWLVRFAKEPKRLAERNLVSMPKFIWTVIKAKVKRSK